MARKSIAILLVGLAFGLVRLAEAQQQAKVAKIGWLASRSRTTPSRELFKREFRELGYVEGKNIVFEIRSSELQFDCRNQTHPRTYL